jgi:hypothetical protein
VTPTIHLYTPADRDWAVRLLTEHFGGPTVVSRGVLQDGSRLPGFVARLESDPVGLVTYAITDVTCEVVVLIGEGVGRPLLEAATEAARAAGCRRIWLITTNDNTRALRFYQRQGWDLVALHRDAMAAGRALKPGIPELGLDGIPIRHELELERLL